MTLVQLLDGVRPEKMVIGLREVDAPPAGIDIPRVQYDSRAVQPGDCFVAVRGSGQDGHMFIQDALSRGAQLIIADEMEPLVQALSNQDNTLGVLVGNTRKALAQIAANYYGRPADRLMLLGVTGTNGKTTTTHVLRSILEANGKKTGLIGTIEYAVGGERIPASHTTPESLELNGLLAKMLDAGCDAVTMEVSSHALDQSRVDGLGFAAAVFTNLTQDHLDYHTSMDRYFAAKEKLFKDLSRSAYAVINIDDSWGKKLAASTSGRLKTYGSDPSATVSVSDIRLSLSGSTFSIQSDGEKREVHSPLLGRFNVWNTLASVATGIALGLPWKSVAEGVEAVPQVRGRFERIVSSKHGWTAIIDYAHTPDALENCLAAIQEVLGQQGKGKVITVFGAGGDRDAGKRPLMGSIAAARSDVVIVTSDNPRTEDPEKIIEDIVQGVPAGSRLFTITDRRDAIEKAVSLADAGDVVLVAGKGHEDYQVLGSRKIPFSDHTIIRELS